MNSTAPGWIFGGNASLTSGGADPAGNGWLRLTTTGGDQFGYAYYDTPFNTPDGFSIEFEYKSWGGSGADGFSVFLFNGANGVPFNVGDVGGSLGYANGCGGIPGLSQAYIGVAFDEYGNFSNPGDRCKDGGPGRTPNEVSIRGPGNGTGGTGQYSYLTNVQLPTGTQRIDCPASLCGNTRPADASYYRKVRLLILPQGSTYSVTVYMQFAQGDPYQTVVNTYTLPTPIYPTVKIGFAGSTGGLNNYHEIRNLAIDVFSSSDDLQMNGNFTGSLFDGGSGQYTMNVQNLGPSNETGPIQVSTTLSSQLTYSGFSSTDSNWSCSAAGQNVTCTYSGSLASGASLTPVDINFSAAPGSGGQTATVSSTVSGQTYDTNPTNDTSNSSSYIYGGATSGVKNLYVYFNNNAGGNPNTLQRIVPTSDSSSGNLNGGGGSTGWMTLTPATVKPVTLNAGNVQVYLCMTRSGGGRNRNLTVDFDYGSGTLTQTLYNVFNPNNNTPRMVPVSLPLASSVTIPAGTPIRLRVTNDSNRNNRTFGVESYNNSCGLNSYSRVELDTDTVINVDSVGVYDTALPTAGNNVAQTIDNGGTLWLRSTISDPFGSFDITDAQFDLYDKNNNHVSGPTSMTLYNDNVAAGQRTYQLSFTVPAWTGSPYTLQVKGLEGTEGTVHHVNAASLDVRPQPPSLVVTKSANKTTASPGDVVTYTVNTTNTGAGDGKNVQLDEQVPKYTTFRINTYGSGQPFQFTDGTPSSGLALGTPQYSNDGGSTYTYTPVSGGGGAPAGYDANVTDFRIPMSGTMPSGGQFSVSYQLRVN